MRMSMFRSMSILRSQLTKGLVTAISYHASECNSRLHGLQIEHSAYANEHEWKPLARAFSMLGCFSMEEQLDNKPTATLSIARLESWLLTNFDACHSLWTSNTKENSFKISGKALVKWTTGYTRMVREESAKRNAWLMASNTQRWADFALQHSRDTNYCSGDRSHLTSYPVCQSFGRHHRAT